MTYFTLWHYLITFISIVIFFAGVFVSFKEKSPTIRAGIILTVFFVAAIIFGFSMMAIDKYTKKAQIIGLKNTRVLRNETIVYSGYVKNIGDYTIGKVEFELELVNRGHATGNVKGGNFYKPSGFFSFFEGGGSLQQKQDNRPQKLLKTFIVAKNLEAGKSKYFQVTLPYPGYFAHTSDFTKLYCH
jgi:hypothetical protein